jgi:uncharacterized protein (TIGR02677 family)
MEAFSTAKDRFILHLTLEDVGGFLQSERQEQLYQSEEDLKHALDQLNQWGNLAKHADVSEVSTLEEFRRTRYLFQLTASGEATEQAIQHFMSNIKKRGELQATALIDIRNLLKEVYQLCQQASSFPSEELEAKIFRSMSSLCSRFEELTSRAQSFLSSIMKPGELFKTIDDGFLSYKEVLIHYIERFIGELARMSDEIAALIQSIEANDIEGLFHTLAKRELIDAIDVDSEQWLATQTYWQKRWEGVRAWFLGRLGSERTQAELLRDRARSAIRSLLQAVQYLNDRVLNRTDRITDLCTLALWFAESRTDDQAHKLWRAAFGLHSARHLGVDDATLNLWDSHPPTPQSSWSAAPPLQITPKLRQSGNYGRRAGRGAPIEDKSKDKMILAELASEEASEIRRAQTLLISKEALRLSDLPELDEVGFSLFLDLLGEVLAQQQKESETVYAVSADGTLEILLKPIPSAPQVCLRTTQGDFFGPDCWIHIKEAGSSEFHNLMLQNDHSQEELTQ